MVYGWRQITEVYDKEHRNKYWEILRLCVTLTKRDVSNAYGKSLHFKTSLTHANLSSPRRQSSKLKRFYANSTFLNNKA